MVAPLVVRQLVAQHPPHLEIRPEPVVRVRPQPKLDRLPRVHVQSQQVRVFVRRELREQPDGELVLVHDVQDGGVGGEALEGGKGRGRVGQMLKRLEAVEPVAPRGSGGKRGWTSRSHLQLPTPILNI